MNITSLLKDPRFIVIAILLIFMSAYFGVAFWYYHTYGQFTSDPASIANLLTIRRNVLSNAIDPLRPNDTNISVQLLNNTFPYNQIVSQKTNALVNFRPMTVRLSGYLGGLYNVLDGVFDPDVGIRLALKQGARAFVLDIDYLEDSPCEPIIVYRDSRRYMRSLHTVAVSDVCHSIAKYGFEENRDPILVIVYLNRIPEGTTSKNTFFGKLASAMDPFSKYHLGLTEQGNFHSCQSEDVLFKGLFTNYQQKFIILTNYDTSQLTRTSNPKDNLHFWTNARIYQDLSGLSASLGSVTPPPPTSPMPQVTIGSTKQLLNISTTDGTSTKYATNSSTVFRIALSDVDYSYSVSDLATILNTLGVQCVPLDVLALSASKDHKTTLQNSGSPNSLADLTNATNSNDPLSFWTHGGWSYKQVSGFHEGFTNPLPVASPIPGYVIPTPIIPKKPPPSTNSNGGLVNIA